MIVKFWGVRGSIPCPGPQTVKYGGNTACIELRFPDIDRFVIIDAGSGIRELSNQIMREAKTRGPIRTELFLTHTHWDHIMGFPFFTPIFTEDARIKIYGPVAIDDNSLEEILGGLLTYRYFPIRQKELTSHIDYIDLQEGRYDLGDGLHLSAKYLNHPILCLGYRFSYKGKVVTTVYDTEPFRNLFCTDPTDPSYDAAMAQEGAEVAAEENQRVERFFADSDLIIHDVQYTQAEYDNSRIGWGHSSIDHAIAAGKRSNVKRLALFHHEPERPDAEIDQLAAIHCRAGDQDDMEVFFAREGMEIEI